MRRVPAFEASLLLLLEPVLNPVWAWLVHGERPGAWSLAGGALILAATAVKTWLDARRPPPSSAHLRWLTGCAKRDRMRASREIVAGGADRLVVSAYRGGIDESQESRPTSAVARSLDPDRRSRLGPDPNCGPPGTGQPWGCELDPNFPPTIAAQNG